MLGRDLDLHGPHEEMQIKADAEEIAGRRRMAWEGVGFSVQRVLRATAAWSRLPVECFHRRQGGTTRPAGNHVCGSKAPLTID